MFCNVRLVREAHVKYETYSWSNTDAIVKYWGPTCLRHTFYFLYQFLEFQNKIHSKVKITRTMGMLSQQKVNDYHDDIFARSTLTDLCKILTGLCKILTGLCKIFEDPQSSLQDRTVLCKILTDLYRILTDLCNQDPYRSLQYLEWSFQDSHKWLPKSWRSLKDPRISLLKSLIWDLCKILAGPLIYLCINL